MKRITSLIVLFPLFVLAQPLSGNYIIASTQPTPFNTLTNAVAYVNNVGISGPVVFLLDNPTYSVQTGEAFPITLGSFPGNTSNTLTIRPNVGKTVNIVASGPNNYTGAPAVLKFNGADNIVVDGSNAAGGQNRNLTLSNGDNISYLNRTVAWIASNAGDPATNIQIVNARLQTTYQNQPQLELSGVYVGNNTTGSNNDLTVSNATAANSGIVIRNDEFLSVRQGIVIRGGTTAALKAAAVTIDANFMGSTDNSKKPSLPISLSYVNNFAITGNTISGVYNNNASNPNITGIRIENGSNYVIRGNLISNLRHTINHTIQYAIHIKGTDTNGVITQNTVTDIMNTGGGIIRALCVETNASNSSFLLISNNMIGDEASSGTTTNAAHGIYIASGKNIRIYHNTVALNTDQNNICATLYVAGGTELDIRNNIFANTGNLGTRYGIYVTTSASAFTQIDYNDYYGLYVGYFGGNKTTIADWQAATGQDTHSVNVKPDFVSISDLHLETDDNPGLEDLGTPLAAVPVDIDNDARSTTQPDMGADEFSHESCSSTTVWNGTSWSNGLPTASSNVIFNSNYTVSQDIVACTLSVSAGVTVSVNPANTITVNGEVNIAGGGNLILENAASLVQLDDEVDNSGTGFIVKRNAQPMYRYDYTYWSSPVVGQTLYNLSPDTRFDKYFGWNATDQTYIYYNNGAHTMQAGKGYVVRAPDTFSTDPGVKAVFTGIFSGMPNNGVYEVGVVGGGSLNLLGNPYPSAISADMFLTAAPNNAVLDGTIYLWTHNTGVSNFQYSSDDYATYNLLGGTGTGTAAPGEGANDNIPNGFIAAGQGFFIKGTNDGQAFFTDAMRVSGNNAQFFRAAPMADVQASERHRIWLNLTNGQGAFKQALIGYATNATNDFDRGYDGELFNSGAVSLYSFVGTQKLSIQGRGLPFEVTDDVALGYATEDAGALSISLDRVDGLFEAQDVFLRDNALGIVHDLKNSEYQFVSGAGTFNSRFEIVYADTSLDMPGFANAKGISVYKQGTTLHIASFAADLDEVEVYDMSGRKILSRGDIGASTVSITDYFALGQILLVRVTTVDGTATARKVAY